MLSSSGSCSEKFEGCIRGFVRLCEGFCEGGGRKNDDIYVTCVE